MSRTLVARNSVMMLAAQIIARAAGLIIFMILARSLTVQDVGLFLYALSSLVGFLVLAVDFGFDIVVTRDAAQQQGDGGAGLALQWKTAMFLVAWPVLAVTTWVLNGTGPVLALVMVVGAAVWHESSGRTITAYFLARGRAEYGLIADSATAVLRFVLLLGVLTAGGRLAAIGWAYALASAVTVPAMAIWACRHGFRPRFRRASGEARRLFAEAAAFAAYSLLFSIYFRLDLLLLGTIGPDAAELGQYAAAFRIIESLLMVPAALTGALLPVLASLDSRADREGFALACAEATRWLAAAGIGLWVVLAVAARLVMRVVAGPGYDPAAWFFQLLLPAFGLISVQCIGLLALNAIGRQRWSVWVMFGGAAFKLAWNLALVPTYGATAACVGSVAAGLLTTCGIVILARPWYHPSAWFRAWVGAAASGAAAAATAAWLPWSLFPRLLLSSVLFIGVAAATGAVRRQDLSMLRALWRHEPTNRGEVG